MASETLPKRQEEPKKAISSRESIKRQIDVKLKLEAQKLKLDFKKLLSVGSLKEFIKSHPPETYNGYREWNKDFCRSALGLKEATPSDQRIRVMALQLFLHEEVGGFTNKPNRLDSFDGKFGTFTLGRLEEYFKKLSPPIKQPETQKTAEIPKNYKEVAPGVLSRLPEGQRFNADNIFYTGDSIMNGIISGKKIKKSNRRAVKSSHLVRTSEAGSKRYKWYKEEKKLIYIEEEALRFIGNKDCRLLVLNGGVNDFYSRSGDVEKISESIKQTYIKIIDSAHKAKKKVAIYTLNKRYLPKNRETARVRRINRAIDKLNQWLISESGADIIYNTDTIAKGRVSEKDGLHMKWQANRDLYAALDKIVKIG